MKERTSSTLNIYRNQSGLVNVPITQGSMRKFSLMQEDYISLVFSLAEPVYFRIGDYIEDDLFGRFYLRNEQMPKYNTSTGGYDYTLRFDAEYWLGENHIFMLTSSVASEPNERKEVSWNLTADLETHVKELVANYNLIQYTLPKPYSYEIESSCEHAGEAKHISYSNTHLISALNMMASEFSCEWWAVNEEIDGVETIVFHFGKCEGTGDSLDFEIGVNVEDMDISDNLKDYANRIYMLGGTKNISASYGRKLILNISDTSNGLFTDGTNVIKPYAGMLLDKGTMSNDGKYTLGTMELTRELGRNKTYTASTGQATVTQDGTVLSWGGITATFDFNILYNDSLIVNVFLNLYVCCSDGMNTTRTQVAQNTLENEAVDSGAAHASYAWQITDGEYSDTVSGNTYYLQLEMLVKYYMGDIQDVHAVGAGYMSVGYGKKYAARVVYEGTTYAVTFNPNYALSTETSQESSYFSFDNGTPSGFGVGSSCELLDYNPIKIPEYYYTEESEDPSSLLTLGERRLHLPSDLCPDGYLQMDDTLAEEQIVEQTIIAENIYPKCYLVVTEVTGKDKTDREKLSDGTERTWVWTAYTIKAEIIDGSSFPMRHEYVGEGEKLQVVFLSDMDTQKAYSGMSVTQSVEGEYLLAGMTFDVDFAELAQEYTLLRNEDYGAKLPNTVLKPTVGDVFVLTGWDVKAMESLGLTDIAEEQLWYKATEYRDALEDGQFTFTCKMMSDWASSFVDGAPLYDADGKQFYESATKEFWVKNDGSLYWLPDIGTKVRIIHGSLNPIDGVSSKESRIIGYELKLDKPWDTPTYVVGETDAYSRIKRIEKELNLQKV